MLRAGWLRGSCDSFAVLVSPGQGATLRQVKVEFEKNGLLYWRMKMVLEEQALAPMNVKSSDQANVFLVAVNPLVFHSRMTDLTVNVIVGHSSLAMMISSTISTKSFAGYSCFFSLLPPLFDGFQRKRTQHVSRSLALLDTEIPFMPILLPWNYK